MRKMKAYIDRIIKNPHLRRRSSLIATRQESIHMNQNYHEMDSMTKELQGATNTLSNLHTSVEDEQSGED